MRAAKKFIGGNWKSNGTLQSVRDLVNGILNPARIDFSKVDLLIAPMAVHVPLVQSIIRKEILVSAQNSSLTGPGAYTGETSPESLKDLGVNWVILGHSERRAFYSEDDAVVAGKVRRALAAGLNVVACVGENLKERENGSTFEVINRQLAAFKGIDWKNVVVAYEPVWAIGTGVSASPAQAQAVHLHIRNWVHEAAKEEVRIIYGGSVTEQSAGRLIREKDIDGFLVGGASLKPGFIDIVTSSYS